MLHLSWKDIHDNAKRFVANHSGDKSEAAQKQTFWNEFFDVFGLRRASFASFEENARNVKGNRAFIDLLWKGKLLVEHKSLGKNLDEASLQAFDYIGDLSKENRWDEVPRFVLVSDFARFNRAMRDPVLFCCDFQWAKISPAVFGSLFQGVMEDRARRQQGAHYTSERDIMKVLRSLFLDELRERFSSYNLAPRYLPA